MLTELSGKSARCLRGGLVRAAWYCAALPWVRHAFAYCYLNI
ncbi:hypothetical protein RF679_13175 [Undibacterium cyanobacteriorum]|uniref:Uncharacterized protein n=1 Tax=Undibacterium cyanobacteriorum TaxID=3073561 RepID=A0ABY9REE2_9BURK|nr:hypothetical protein [Undibacterium sp. 20NA77.5]WMW79598.1 hypothetical protein RF679_13175 [Undibacterium sp. 20NA77.5]